MKKFITENFRFTITVTKGGGCRNGHEIGDTYTCEYGCPMPLGDESGICVEAMIKMFPLLEIVRSGGDLRTLGGSEKHKIEITCPDGPIKFLIEGVDLMEIRQIKANPPQHSFGCFIGDKIIGNLNLTDTGSGAYEIEDLSVLREYHHFGYEQQLLEFAKNYMASHR